LVKLESVFATGNAFRKTRIITDEASKSVPQGLKPDVFSIVYGPTKVVP